LKDFGSNLKPIFEMKNSLDTNYQSIKNNGKNVFYLKKNDIDE